VDFVTHAVTVGFLGGPYDGRLQAFPANANGLPGEYLVVAEPTGSVAEWSTKWFAMATTEAEGNPPLFREVYYRLAVNRADSGPLLVYVHPDLWSARG
jgi:hypothetical protein